MPRILYLSELCSMLFRIFRSAIFIFHYFVVFHNCLIIVPFPTISYCRRFQFKWMNLEQVICRLRWEKKTSQDASDRSCRSICVKRRWLWRACVQVFLNYVRYILHSIIHSFVVSDINQYIRWIEMCVFCGFRTRLCILALPDLSFGKSKIERRLVCITVITFM